MTGGARHAFGVGVSILSLGFWREKTPSGTRLASGTKIPRQCSAIFAHKISCLNEQNTPTPTHTHIYIYLYLYIHVYKSYLHTWINICVCIYICIYAYITHICQTHTHTHVCIYIISHTYTQYFNSDQTFDLLPIASVVARDHQSVLRRLYPTRAQTWCFCSVPVKSSGWSSCSPWKLPNNWGKFPFPV